MEYVVFGAGQGGRRVVDSMRRHDIAFIVDNNSALWGTEVNGIQVRSPKVLIHTDRDRFRVIVASSGYAQIRDQLTTYGMLENYHFWNGLSYENLVFNGFENHIRFLYEMGSKDITRQRQEIALRHTAVYVDQKMASAKCFASRSQMLDYSLSLAHDQGLFLEFGVFMGESLRHLARRAGRTVYGFDSFEGLPENWRADYPKGTFSVGTIPDVPGAELVVGWFDATLPGFLTEHTEPCAFLHVDCDLYSSTQTVLQQLCSRIRSGTVIVFDEYFNYPGWEHGEFRAFQEFIRDSHLTYEYVAYCQFGEQAAVRIL